ncbi:RadC family protein [Pelistega ratti]|uniref:RadC family protein n=1 Tax=Pelistega ratti TaxID=2652177 RepID=UPI00135B0E06|nr:DNA repair protein RadC [Pelistega ratti]
MTSLPIISLSERPRERLIKHGPKVLSTAELLAIIISTGTKGNNVLNFCDTLLEHFGGIRALLNASSEELSHIKGLGNAKISQLLALKELAARALEEPLRQDNILNQSTAVKNYCIHHLGHLEVEHCYALLLNKGFKLIHTAILAEGTIDQAQIYPREVLKLALRFHATYIILAHNHPSGSLEPSHADLQITDHLKEVLALVDIKLLDHMIIANGKAVSLAELGYISS